ncbi:NERD domain-containing protein/DEAD/DEAH box helicase [Serratia marcescens]|uniref:nuclease-related domain-containing DEAD/DEAH box helicase n=1 Tax=Serratia marcescens TaxID=615 RepID=UPI0023AF1C3E|nr:NERD domain-containing protein/DEAD/DEAH box helicase [Serratia marcescens]WEE07192.1 NERD domain-containing protein/DEAD/DEAH box helicase [Serratia marcescens]
MIPGFIDETSPPGEIDLYRKLESARCNWTVIHSLDLAPSNHNRRTELDFVIVIPDVGILCIEVKSHREIGFDGDHWYPESITKSPFRQAEDARYALRRRLVERLAIFSQVPVIHCCVFPRADFTVLPNLSVSPYEVMDRYRFDACRTGDELCEALKIMALRIINADPTLTLMKVPLSGLQVEDFVSFCFPIRTRRPEKITEIRYREEELEKLLRDQQYPVLRLTDYNPRVLVEGGAGTGKSLIGLGVARLKAAQGLRVGYLCFNRLIGQWAASQLEEEHNPLLVGGSVLSVLMSLTGVSVPENPNDDFWSGVAQEVQDRLTDPSCAYDAQFDYLVIDEAQDILGRPDLFDCLRLLIDGDLDGGRFLMLGDFRNQVLTGAMALEVPLATVRKNSACWILTENCRNYKTIGQFAMKLSQADRSTYSGYLRQGGGLNAWNLELYKDAADQIRKIMICIDSALASGFREADITVLSFGSERRSVLPLLREACNRTFVSVGNLSTKGIRYSTVPAYKGLENKVIIITDVIPSDSGFDRNRFYTGITRAQERLHLFCHASGASQLAEWVTSAR